jgi:hypothetical protein
MEVGGAGVIVIIDKMYPRMKAIELQLNIRQKVFIGQLIVKLILILYAVSFDLLLSD